VVVVAKTSFAKTSIAAHCAHDANTGEKGCRELKTGQLNYMILVVTMANSAFELPGCLQKLIIANRIRLYGEL
jgi:hypothetical protein